MTHYQVLKRNVYMTSARVLSNSIEKKERNAIDAQAHYRALPDAHPSEAGKQPARRAEIAARANSHPVTSVASEDDESPLQQEIKALLRCLSEGDAGTFWRLWEIHNDYLYVVCLGQMGGIKEDAEDALSRTKLKAWESLPRYAGVIINLRAWLTRLTCNLCMDMHRERHRRTRVMVSAERMQISDTLSPASTRESPESEYLQRELWMHVRQGVRQLPSPLRKPFILRFVQERPYDEIAEQLILSTDNARKRVQLARAILRRQLIDLI